MMAVGRATFKKGFSSHATIKRCKFRLWKSIVGVGKQGQTAASLVARQAIYTQPEIWWRKGIVVISINVALQPRNPSVGRIDGVN